MFVKASKLAIIASAVAGLAFASAAQAQDIKYPVDTVTLVTHSSPGGGTDVYLREMVKFLAPALGAELAVENVKGGSGAKAIAKVANSPADGSIFYGSTPSYVNMSLLSKPEFGHDSVEPVVGIFLDPQVIYVRKDSALKSFTDIIADAKANPGKQKWGTGTPASLERQALEEFKKKVGVDVTIVTHDGGGDMMINVLNGSLDLGIGEIQEFRGQIEAGEVRVIGVFTEDRLPDFPDAKTAKEEGIDMVVKKFRGIVGPKGLPPEVIQAWEAAVPKVLLDPEFQKWYKAASLIPAFMNHEEFTTFMASVVREQDAYFKEYGITTVD
ncbi:MAG TPA: tripartite tricarboxylate transporter substrate binding protein [Dongiaceae bacterium]|nr:tripartite tricarboxylate transporter substrate binding protein [Dongiaceae bacterium]